MLQIEAYKCSDGSIFECEEAANAHDEDLLGQELDGLLKLFEFGGLLTRIDENRALLRLMGKNRRELEKSLFLILQILQHGK